MMEKFEYQVITFPILQDYYQLSSSVETRFQKELNKEALKGWRVIAITPVLEEKSSNPVTSRLLIVLERPKPTQAV